MRQSTFLTLALAVVTSVFGIFLPAPEVSEKDIKGQNDHVFQVVVAGYYSSDASDDNAKVGSDVWEGANAFVRDRKPSFDLVQSDDRNQESIAIENAGAIERNPRVLAVIGHSFSATTRAPAENYANVGIPFIVPVATAQSAVYPRHVPDDQLDESSERFDNVFRLRPSDDKAQAPAIAYLVARIAGWKARHNQVSSASSLKVHLVLSSEGKAPAYSEPLGRKIHHLLREGGFNPDRTSHLDTTNSTATDTTMKEIVNDHNQNDIVIFCGYLTQAKKFLETLKQSYNTAGKLMPTFIFSEAATQIELAYNDIVIYRTSPEDIGRCGLSVALRRIGTTPSAEFISGYDAAQLISIAVGRCGTAVSRRCVLRQLQEATALPGACRGYSFRDGESVLSSYYVFRSGAAPDISVESDPSMRSGSPPPTSLEISPGDIIQLQAQTGVAKSEYP